MKMKDVMNLFHISEGTIRYYERMGIINPKRDENNYRVFDFDSLVNLVMCQKYNDFGLTYKESVNFLRDRTLGDNISMLEKSIENNKDRLQKLNAINMYYQNLALELKRHNRGNVFTEKIHSLCFYELRKGDFDNSIDAFKDDGISEWMNYMDISDFEIWGNVKKYGEFEWKRVLTVDTEFARLYSGFVPRNCNCLSEKQNYVTYSTVQFHAMDQLNNEAFKALCAAEKHGYNVTGIVRVRILMTISEMAYMKICVEIGGDEKTKMAE